MEREYIVNGDPIPLARARFGSSKGVKRVWDSQKQLKLVAQLSLKEQHGNEPLLKGPLLLDVTFVMEIPRSWSQKKKDEQVGKYHSFKPDASNLLKFIEDIATGIIYHDDALIAHVIAKKVYGDQPRTIMIVKEIN